MIQTKTGEKFVESLNRRIGVSDGKIRKRPLTREKMNGTKILCLHSDQRLDRVIEGPDVESVSFLSPQAEIAIRDRSIWLNTARTEIPLVIAIFPERGRDYPPIFKRFLKREFPHITWLFPKLRKCLRNDATLYPHILAEAFVQAEVLALTEFAKEKVKRHFVL